MKTFYFIIVVFAFLPSLVLATIKLTTSSDVAQFSQHVMQCIDLEFKFTMAVNEIIKMFSIYSGDIQPEYEDILKDISAIPRNIIVRNLTEPVKCTNIISNNYIFYIGSFEDLVSILARSRGCPTWNPLSSLIIISTNKTLYNSIDDIVEKLREHKLYETLFISRNATTDKMLIAKLTLITACSSDHKEIKQNTIKLVKKCENGVTNSLGPMKLAGYMKNCAMNVRTVVYPPFIFAPESKISTDEYNFTKGIEIQYINAIAKVLQVKVKYTLAETAEDWGDVYWNGTATGSFKALIDQEADIAISSLSATNNRVKWLDAIVINMDDTYKYCVPHARLKPEWSKLKPISTIKMFMVILSLFVCMTIVSKKLATFRNRDEYSMYKSYSIVLIVWQVLLSSTYKLLPKTDQLRFLFVMWSFLSLFVYTNYQSNLVSTLTRYDYSNQIASVEEMVEERLNVLINKFFLAFYEGPEDPTTEALKQLMKQCNNFDRCISRVAHRRDCAVVLASSYIPYAIQNYVDKSGVSLLYCFNHNILSLPLMIYVRKGYPLIVNLATLMKRIESSGIIAKWQKDVVHGTPTKLDAPAMKSISLSYFQGMFYLLIIGNLLGALVFVGENLIYRRKRGNKHVEVIVKPKLY